MQGKRRDGSPVGARGQVRGDLTALRRACGALDGRPYPAYRDLQGWWELGPGLLLQLAHAQGDPFAGPSRLRVVMSGSRSGLAPWCKSPRSRLAVGDLILRRFHERADEWERRRGSGKSGLLDTYRPEQVLLPRSAVAVEEDGEVEVRFYAGLPAAGRRILGREAEALLAEDARSLAEAALEAASLGTRDLDLWVSTAEDQEALRAKLKENGWVAFLAEGSILPRRSGSSDLPARGEGVVPLLPPPELTATVQLPHRGLVRGMVIPRGVTLIVGGGFHGKSTLLAALQHGVYDHIPGDGRELCVTDESAVKIRAEDGRRVEGVDVSAFIGDLPGGVSSRSLCTSAASGSTSQAANLVEAVEAGARVLLMDEDTCATNLMVRDARMQRLVPADAEPIRPLVDRVRRLYERWSVSTVLVAGGLGDYLDVADTVILMQEYRPRVVTEQARQVAEQLPTHRLPEGEGELPSPPQRRVQRSSLLPQRADDVKIRAREVGTLEVGHTRLDLRRVEQVAEVGQTRAIGELLRLLGRRPGESRIRDLLDEADAVLTRDGLDGVGREAWDLAQPRRYELAAAINRLPSLVARPE